METDNSQYMEYMQLETQYIQCQSFSNYEVEKSQYIKL